MSLKNRTQCFETKTFRYAEIMRQSILNNLIYLARVMENSENPPFEAFQEKLKQLNPRVREKAVGIARKLVEQEKYKEKDAV